MTIEALKNAKYQSEFSPSGSVKLTAGIYKRKIVPGGATERVVMLSQEVALGDLDSDGAEDAAGVLITNSGGSGTFRHLAAILKDHGSARNLATLFLGDRVKVNLPALPRGASRSDRSTGAMGVSFQDRNPKDSLRGVGSTSRRPVILTAPPCQQLKLLAASCKEASK